MTPKAPPKRTRFRNGWDEVEYLYQQILHWYYEREDRDRALGFVGRLEQLLGQLTPGHDSVFAEECWSLLEELRGDLPAAIRHRKHEIDLILTLWELSANTPGMPAVLRRYGVDDLADRFDLLAVLYHDSDDLEHAIVTLMRSKWLCESFKVPYEGESLLQEYLYEDQLKSSPGLINALRKQGWKFPEQAHDRAMSRDARPDRVRTTRLRGRGAS